MQLSQQLQHDALHASEVFTAQAQAAGIATIAGAAKASTSSCACAYADTMAQRMRVCHCPGSSLSQRPTRPCNVCMKPCMMMTGPTRPSTAMRLRQ